MSRRPEPGKPAKYKYHTVKYTHFDVGPDGSQVLTADPWSYAYAWLKKNGGKRGEKRRRFELALYYLEQAEGFYNAAQSVELPTEATLVYYGLLNLAKAFISVEGVLLGSGFEHHGLNLGGEFEVAVAKRPKGNYRSIFHDFCRCLGRPVKAQHVWNVKDVCSHVPEIHQMAFELGHLTDNKQQFIPVRVEFLVNEENDKLFTELRYDKRNETRIANLQKLFLKGPRAAYFRLPEEREDWVVFRSKVRRAVDNKKWPRVYRNTVKQYQDFDLCSLLSRSGYRYYCDLSGGPYHQLAFVIMLMFYVGCVARYRPEETRKLLDGELGPLITEAMAICPRQFLYQMVSLITKTVCVVPYALLD